MRAAVLIYYLVPLQNVLNVSLFAPSVFLPFYEHLLYFQYETSRFEYGFAFKSMQSHGLLQCAPADEPFGLSPFVVAVQAQLQPVAECEYSEHRCHTLYTTGRL